MYRLRRPPLDDIPGESKVAIHRDFLALDEQLLRPKRILHSKNPYKVKKKKIPLEPAFKQRPLDGNTILRICKCEYAEEVLKLDISGKGYTSIYKNDMKNFVNIMELDMSDNKLQFEDIDYLLNVNKLNLSNNQLQSPVIRPNTLPSLMVLDLSFNQLTPDSLVCLQVFVRLKHLSLVGNLLDHLPSELLSLQALENLNVSHNTIVSDSNTSKLWRMLGDFRQLTHLSLTGNKLRGIHTEHLMAGDFHALEVLDFRDNSVDDQQQLICARNFSSLKKLYVTGNPFCSYPFDYLKDELAKRVGAELINETVAYKLQQDILKKKPVPIIFENFVVIKNDEFRKKVNTEFFGVDIPVFVDQPKQESFNKQVEDGFFMTGAGVETNPKQEERLFPPNIYDLKLDTMMQPETLQYNQFLSLSKLYLGEEIEYERPLELTDAYRNLRAHIRTSSTLDHRLDNPEYMKPTRAKIRTSDLEAISRQAKADNVSKLSAFNADRRLAGVRMMVDGVVQKMKLPKV